MARRQGFGGSFARRPEANEMTKRSRVVLTPEAELPYKVVLEHEGGPTEYPVATVRDGEALIRAKSPPAPFAKIEKLREWNDPVGVRAESVAS